MPFRLKNAGVTYQQKVSKVFRGLIGDKIEAYRDDMIVKSREASSYIKNLEDVFSHFRSFYLRLNPTKCTFGIEVGEFLGDMITQRGIEANPKKIQALLDILALKNTKEV